MSNQVPVISVIVLCYNQEVTVSRTIDSILRQKSSYSFEIIIGDDASKDGTRAIVEKYATEHSNLIRVMPQFPNKGILKNYQDCLIASRGKYIATCAGDDWWQNENKLQLQVNFLEANLDYGVVYTEYDSWYSDEKILKPNSNSNDNKYCPSGNVFMSILESNFITAPTALFRSDLLQYVDFNLYTRLGFYMEDYPMWLEFSQKTKFQYLCTSTTTYTIANGSICNNSNNEMLAEKFELSVLAVKWHFVKQLPKIDLTHIYKMEDSVYLKLLNIGFLNGNRKFAAKYADKIHELDLRLFAKKIIAKNSFLFRIYYSFFQKKRG